MLEIWKDIKDYEGLYQVSNLGRVKSLANRSNHKKELILKQHKYKGYYKVNLCKNGKRKLCSVHRLVAEAFIQNPENLPCVNHKDENKLNNCIENLEWCTHGYNNSYGTRLERVFKKLSKKVLQYDLNGNFIKEYSSVSEAAKYVNGSAANICSVISGRYRYAYGSLWKYKD